jgi:hypothetical protein
MDQVDVEDNPNHHILLSCSDAFDGSSWVAVFQLECQKQQCNYDICFAWFSSSVVRCFGTWVSHIISVFSYTAIPFYLST